MGDYKAVLNSQAFIKSFWLLLNNECDKYEECYWISEQRSVIESKCQEENSVCVEVGGHWYKVSCRERKDDYGLGFKHGRGSRRFTLAFIYFMVLLMLSYASLESFVNQGVSLTLRSNFCLPVQFVSIVDH